MNFMKVTKIFPAYAEEYLNFPVRKSLLYVCSVCVHICACVCTHVCICTCGHIHVCVCIYMYVCLYVLELGLYSVQTSLEQRIFLCHVCKQLGLQANTTIQSKRLLLKYRFTSLVLGNLHKALHWIPRSNKLFQNSSTTGIRF